MIIPFYLSKKRIIDLQTLFECVEKYSDSDFYFTKDNIRYYITNPKVLKNFLRESVATYVFEKKGGYLGSINVLKSIGGDKKRYYIKLIAEDFNIAKGLISVLTWNFKQDLYIKIRKNYKFVSILKSKGFRFSGGRGSQILLYRKYIPIPSKPKEEENKEE